MKLPFRLEWAGLRFTEDKGRNGFCVGSNFYRHGPLITGRFTLNTISSKVVFLVNSLSREGRHRSKFTGILGLYLQESIMSAVLLCCCFQERRTHSLTRSFFFFLPFTSPHLSSVTFHQSSFELTHLPSHWWSHGLSGSHVINEFPLTVLGHFPVFGRSSILDSRSLFFWCVQEVPS